jgi:acyl-CoA synthetase (AMP-forming)/AMP-acid ligase II
MTLYHSPVSPLILRDLSITERFFEGLGGDPDRVVMIDGPSGREMTAGALRNDILRLAGGLAARGIGPGKVVAIMAPNMPEYATVFHAIAYAGATVTTINPTYTPAEVRHQLIDAAADVAVTVPAFLDTMKSAAEGSGVQEILVIGEAVGHASIMDVMGDPLPAQVPVDLDDHIVVLPYSSGTTGLPKGVMLSHRNLVVNTDQVLAMLQVQPGEVTVAFLPFFHIYGLNVLMNPFIAAGATLVTLPRFDLEAVLTHIQTHRVRRLLVAPPVAIALAKHPMVDQFDLSSLQMVLSAAAPLGADVAEAVAARLNCVTIQGYGMTELSPMSHCVQMSAPRVGSVGVLTPNTQGRIVDPETGKALPAGQEGEVWVRGPQVMKGYLNNAEATARTLDADGWLRTGDLGVMDEHGHLYIRDRLKELIKVKGFQVAPAEVEAELLADDAVADAAVIGVPDDEAGEVPVAFVVPVAGTAPDAASILARLRSNLAGYKVPRTIHFVDAIPKSASGKILRRILRDTLAAAG